MCSRVRHIAETWPPCQQGQPVSVSATQWKMKRNLLFRPEPFWVTPRRAFLPFRASPQPRHRTILTRPGFAIQLLRLAQRTHTAAPPCPRNEPWACGRCEWCDCGEATCAIRGQRGASSTASRKRPESRVVVGLECCYNRLQVSCYRRLPVGHSCI